MSDPLFGVHLRLHIMLMALPLLFSGARTRACASAAVNDTHMGRQRNRSLPLPVRRLCVTPRLRDAIVSWGAAAADHRRSPHKLWPVPGARVPRALASLRLSQESGTCSCCGSAGWLGRLRLASMPAHQAEAPTLPSGHPKQPSIID